MYLTSSQFTTRVSSCQCNLEIVPKTSKKYKTQLTKNEIKWHVSLIVVIALLLSKIN